MRIHPALPPGAVPVHPAWELIVIDNGSTDETAAYLAGVQDATSVPVTLITNARNVGFPAAINQGLQNASGEFLVLLNNDAVVTELWLDQLIALTRVGADGGAPELRGGQVENGDKPPGSVARSAPGSEATPRLTPHTTLPTPRIGLVGPMSNYVSPPQLIGDLPYRDLDAMHAFAGNWRAEHWGKWFTAPKLSGFCVLMTRAVYDAVGGLDERFGLRLFDDDDLAMRARRAGFELAVAHDLFVHHFGSRTFAGNGIDAEALLRANERRFADKWGQEIPRGRRVALSDGTRPRPTHTSSKRPRVNPRESCTRSRFGLVSMRCGQIRAPTESSEIIHSLALRVGADLAQHDRDVPLNRVFRSDCA
jgi:O-antigen biosynthesis protein